MSATFLEMPSPTQYPDAECLRLPNPDIFFGGKHEVPRAKAVCVACPHRQQCLDDIAEFEAGVPDQHLFGVYGGMTAGERALARKPQTPAEKPRGRSAATRRFANSRGSSYDRRVRKRWLLENTLPSMGPEATMCYRCRRKLHWDNLFVARKDPDKGYARDNIRASCSDCVNKYGSIIRPRGRPRKSRSAA